MLAIGIDISKKKIDIWMNNKLTTLSNNEALIKKFFLPIKSGDVRIVMEATGRYHRISHQVLTSMGFPVMVINPFQSRHFAKSMNVLCKTDRVDAKVLSQFAERMDFKQTIPLRASEAELRDLIRHLDDLKDVLKQYKQRVDDSEGFSRKSLDRLIKSIKEEIATAEKEIDRLIGADKKLSHNRGLLITIPGIGKNTAAMLLGLLRELGTVSNKAIAALAGLAPMNFDSGRFQGKRRVQKGRHDVRRLLYMPTMGAATQHNKTLNTFYKGLIKEGKPAKVALTACMRKLLIFANSTLKQGTPWEMRSGTKEKTQESIGVA